MKRADQEVLTYLDYFRGGVPAGAIFDLHMRSLRELIKKRFKLRAHVSVQAEVCLIGGVAYFEAFCGDHFASILNLCPQLAVRLKENGRDVSIDATDLLALEGNPRTSVRLLPSDTTSERRTTSTACTSICSP